MSMMTHTDDNAERQLRLEQRLAEFRTAQQQRLVKRGVALWRRTEAERGMTVAAPAHGDRDRS